MTVDTGSTAPYFSLPGDGNSDINLSEYRGQKLVLFFYPKDSTPGCTTESIEFSENIAEFNNAGTQVIGVSKDSVKRHDNFITKNGLKVRLVSDEEGMMLENYGVWVDKKNYGKTYMGIERTTMVIDVAGNIIKIWRKVRVKGHVAEVLEFVKSL